MRLEALVVLPLLAVGVMLDGSATKNWRRRVLAVGLFLVSVAPVLVGWYLWYRSASQVGSGGYFETAADKLGGPSLQIVKTLVGNLPALPVHLMGLLIFQRPMWYLAAPLCCILIPGIVVSWRRREMLLLVLAAGYVLFHLTWDVSSINSRYLMPMLPLVAMWLVDGLRAIFDWVARVRPGWAVRISAKVSTASVVAVVAAMSLLPGLVETVRWKLQPTPCQTRSKRDVAVYDVAMWVRGHVSADEVVVAREGSILHYLTGRRVLLPPVPAPGQSDDEFHKAWQQVMGRASVLVVGPPGELRDALLSGWVTAHGGQVDLLASLAGYRVYRKKS
jgi:hypothetical protein